MASVEAIASLRIGQAWAEAAPEGIAAEDLYSGSVDFEDAFHQFLVPEVAEWFCFDIPGITAGELGVTEVWDDDVKSFVPVEPWENYGPPTTEWRWVGVGPSGCVIPCWMMD